MRPDAAIQGPKVFRKCPMESCRGFLSSKWTCQLCTSVICAECNEQKVDEEHVCDPGNIESVALLRKDTKSCPGCGEMIYKISGCAQMWCPSCHVAFDWNTLRIEKGLVHNPHYYEFMRNNGNINREHGDIPCGGFPTLHEIQILLRGYSEGTGAIFFSIHRLVRHISAVNIIGGMPADVDFQEYRVRYMLGEMSEKEFQYMITKTEKSRDKARDQYNIFRMFVDVAGDMMRQVILKQLDIPDFTVQIDRLREYCNENFVKVQKRYNSTVEIIHVNWTMMKYSKSVQKVQKV